MARTEPQINLRIPAELKDQLDQAAAENKRSLTAEVVARLEQTFLAPAKLDTSGEATMAVVLRLAALEQQLASRTREETFERLKHMRQGLAMQVTIERDRVERERERLERMEVDAEAADDRGDRAAAKRLRTKLREDRKFLRQMEETLETIRDELREVERSIDAFGIGPAS